MLRKGKKLRQLIISILIVCGVSALCYLLSPYIGYRVIALLLLVTVSFIAMFFDIWPVLLAALLSALIWNFFFIPPKFTFSIGNTEDALMFLMYFVIASLNGVLTYKIRLMKKKARQREEKENAIKLYNTLFNSLSHELQTPISTIIGATDILKESDTKLTEKNKNELIDEISIASIRLNEQVENLLNISRLESGYLKLKRDWCDINELIYSAVNKLQNKSGKRKIEIFIPENFPLFDLDFGIMEQVFYNLLNNAIQYTPENSVISIEAIYNTTIEGHFDTVDDDIGKTFRDSVSNKLVITITDTGKGFPENEIEKVFDKFYRLHNAKTGGTGLGLSIVKGFVEAHHGTIRLRNIPTGGAEFTIEIPAKTSYLNSLKNE
jgi:two-component system, OmpR family, sensor histidine kinase KdpD